jgi:uncharacterized protein YkwD
MRVEFAAVTPVLSSTYRVGRLSTATRRTAGRFLVWAPAAVALLRAGKASADDEPAAVAGAGGDESQVTGAPPVANADAQRLAELSPPPQITPLELQQLALVNGARATRGLPGLEWDATMAAVARAHATDMMKRANVSHSGSDGSTPAERMRQAGVKFQYGSENIWTYWGQAPEQGPSTMHAAMMAEKFAPGVWNHIGNILYPGYKRIGIGIVVASGGVQYLSECFAD